MVESGMPSGSSKASGKQERQAQFFHTFPFFGCVSFLAFHQLWCPAASGLKPEDSLCLAIEWHLRDSMEFRGLKMDEHGHCSNLPSLFGRVSGIRNSSSNDIQFLQVESSGNPEMSSPSSTRQLDISFDAQFMCTSAVQK